MKLLFLAALMVAQSAFADSANTSDKTLIYCDYNSETMSMYLDLYFPQDSTQKDAYTTPEVGFLVDENSAYPDYLGQVTATYNGSEAMINAQKDGTEVNFTLATNGTSTPAIVLQKSADGQIMSFDLHVTGTTKDTALDVTFNCYDPAASSAAPR